LETYNRQNSLVMEQYYVNVRLCCRSTATCNDLIDGGATAPRGHGLKVRCQRHCQDHVLIPDILSVCPSAHLPSFVRTYSPCAVYLLPSVLLPTFYLSSERSRPSNNRILHKRHSYITTGELCHPNIHNIYIIHRELHSINKFPTSCNVYSHRTTRPQWSPGQSFGIRFDGAIQLLWTTKARQRAPRPPRPCSRTGRAFLGQFRPVSLQRNLSSSLSYRC
jgi:hypothetical protein